MCAGNSKFDTEELLRMAKAGDTVALLPITVDPSSEIAVFRYLKRHIKCRFAGKVYATTACIPGLHVKWRSYGTRHDASCNRVAEGIDGAGQILIEHGADVNHRTKSVGTSSLDHFANLHGETPLHVAAVCAGVDFIDVLLKGGADKTIKSSKGNIAFDYAEEKKRETAIIDSLRP